MSIPIRNWSTTMVTGEPALETLTSTRAVRVPITATLQKLDDIRELKKVWLSLQERSDHSYFQSWGWIGTWLDLLPKELPPKVVIARHPDGSVVGVGIIFERISGRLRTRRAYLNQTGDPKFDSIWVQYNGFLVDSRYQREATAACLKALYWHRPRFAELRLNGVYQDYEQIIPETPYYQIVRDRSPTWIVDVETLRREGRDYLSTLSKNCRQQIRRSIRLYEKRGPLTIELARSTEEAKGFLAQIAVLTKQRHAKLGNTSAFESPFFLSFHEALLERRFKYGEVLLFRVRAGDQTIGYLYRLQDKSRVYDYQGGFQYEGDRHYMPGFVCSVMATRHSLAAGVLVDDLMAGDAHYKARLCEQDKDLLWLTLHRSRISNWAHRAAAALRRIQYRNDTSDR